MKQTPVSIHPILRRPESLPGVRRVEATAVVVDRADDELPTVRQRIDSQLPQPRFGDDGRALRRDCLYHYCLPQEKLRGRGRLSNHVIELSCREKVRKL